MIVTIGQIIVKMEVFMLECQNLKIVCNEYINLVLIIWAASRELLFSGLPTRSDTKPQKMARGLKFRLKELEGLYYLGSKTKVLISCAVDLRLC